MKLFTRDNLVMALLIGLALSNFMLHSNMGKTQTAQRGAMARMSRVMQAPRAQMRGHVDGKAGKGRMMRAKKEGQHQKPKVK
jgi:hypothetical protein